jgi:hypothetical protein
MESAMVTEALELTFEEKDSSFSRALWSLIFWVLFNESCISLISLSLSLWNLFAKEQRDGEENPKP